MVCTVVGHLFNHLFSPYYEADMKLINQSNLALVAQTNRWDFLLWLNFRCKMCFSHSHEGLALIFYSTTVPPEELLHKGAETISALLVTPLLCVLGCFQEHIWPVSLIKLVWVKTASALRSLWFKGLKGSALFVHSWPCKSLHTPTWASNTPPQQKPPAVTAGITSVYSITYCSWLCWMLSRSFVGWSKILIRQPPRIYWCSSIFTRFACCI